MRILLDECLPARLQRDLPGHKVQTVPQAGWAGVKNGKLLRLITAAAAFDVFLTMDKNLPREQKTTALPFAIVILRAKSNRFEDTHPLMPEVLRRLGRIQARPCLRLQKADLSAVQRRDPNAVFNPYTGKLAERENEYCTAELRTAQSPKSLTPTNPHFDCLCVRLAPVPVFGSAS